MALTYTLRGAALACLVAATMGGGASAEDANIDGPQAFAEAVDARQVGTLLLSGGAYGPVMIRGVSASVGDPLVIESADPDNPAVLSELEVREASNITFRNIVFDYSFEASHEPHFRPFQVIDSDNISIESSVFNGDVATGVSRSSDGYPTAFGLGVRNSVGISLLNSEVKNFYRGVVVSGSRQIKVAGNDFHSIRMDGMNFAEVTDVTIERNHIHDFVRSVDSKDHADMIQFWTNGTETPSRRVTIRDNILNSADGWFTQSIFMRNDLVDRGIAGPEMFYEDIRIEGNLIINAHLHGITVGETNGLVVSRNTVVKNSKSEGKRDNPGLWIPQIRVAPTSRAVRIEANVTSKIVGFVDQADWQVSDNVLVQSQSPMKPNYYMQVFSERVLREPERLRSYLPRRNGPLDRAGVGSPLLSEAGLNSLGRTGPRSY